MKNINQNEFKGEVRDFKGVALVDFYADWCGPCKMLSPLLEEMSKNNNDPEVKFLKMNVDSEQALSQILGIMSIPTVIIFKDGKIVSQKVGVSSKEDYTVAIGDAKRFEASGKRKVTVLSTPTCPYCHLVKKYLQEKQIEFEDIDVSVDDAKAREMVERSGQMSVPQLWIDDQVVVGFNQHQINMLLGIR